MDTNLERARSLAQQLAKQLGNDLVQLLNAAAQARPQPDPTLGTAAWARRLLEDVRQVRDGLPEPKTAHPLYHALSLVITNLRKYGDWAPE